MSLVTPPAPFRPGDGLTTPHRIWFDGGIKETWTRSLVSAEVLYECAYDDRYALAKELKGFHPIGGLPSFINISVPHAYPPSPNMFCMDVTSIEGRGAKKVGWSKWSPYTIARLTVVYEVPPFAVNPTFADSSNQIDPDNPILFCTQKVKGSAAFRTLPEGKVIFATSKKVVEGSAGKPEAQAEILLEFPHVPFNPYLFVRPYLGKVNSVPMFGHDVGEVLFDAIDAEDRASLTGTEHSASLAFLARVGATWNQLMNEDGVYEDAVFKSTGNPIFASADLFDLFK